MTDEPSDFAPDAPARLRTAAEGGTRIAYAADPSMTTVQVVS